MELDIFARPHVLIYSSTHIFLFKRKYARKLNVKTFGPIFAKVIWKYTEFCACYNGVCYHIVYEKFGSTTCSPVRFSSVTQHPTSRLKCIRTSMLKVRVFPNYKNMIRIIWFCIVLTAYTCSLHENQHYHVWSSMVYVKQAMTSTLRLAVVAIIFTPNNVKTISIFIVILH